MKSIQQHASVMSEMECRPEKDRQTRSRDDRAQIDIRSQPDVAAKIRGNRATEVEAYTSAGRLLFASV
jgi:hypothetical protein